VREGMGIQGARGGLDLCGGCVRSLGCRGILGGERGATYHVRRG